MKDANEILKNLIDSLDAYNKAENKNTYESFDI